MRFVAPLVRATLVRRYQRFLADVDSADGSRITAHCPNTGAVHTVRPAVEIDPQYADALRAAAAAGVMLLGYGARVKPREIVLQRRVACNV